MQMRPAVALRLLLSPVAVLSSPIVLASIAPIALVAQHAWSRGAAVPIDAPIAAPEGDATESLAGEAAALGAPCDVRLWIAGLATTPGFRWSSSACDDGPGSAGGVRAGALLVEAGVPVIYATGCFDTVLDQPVGAVVRWGGSTWSEVGTLPSGSGRAIVAWDDGGVTKLAVAGSFGNPLYESVQLFDGSSWSQLGGDLDGAFNGKVRSITTHDDGSGPRIVVGGDFTQVGDVVVSRLAQWTGAAWEPLGAGANGAVRALVSGDLGDGPRLFAGGSFTLAGGVSAKRIASWDGEAWSPLGAGTNSGVLALVLLGEGNGASDRGDDGDRVDGGVGLWAGGDFTTIGGLAAPYLARWNGTAWSDAAPGIGNSVDALAATELDGEPTLLVARGVPRAWRAGVWIQLGQLAGGSVFNQLAGFAASPEAPDTVAVLGSFTFASSTYAPGAAQWNGERWRSMPEGLGGFGTDDGVYDLLSEAREPGGAITLAGAFERVGGMLSPCVARWSPSGFERVGAAEGGSLAGAAFHVAKWPDPRGENLLASGGFAPFSPAGNEAVGLALFDGQQWTPFADVSNEPGGVVPYVFPTCVFDDGQGESLYVGGEFTTIAGVSASRIARFDGVSWHSLGSGLNGPVWALEVFDDGSGPALYVGGYFTSAGGESAVGIARWDGEAWSSVGVTAPDLARPATFTAGSVQSLATFDDGSGVALYAGGLLGVDGPGQGWPGTGVHRWDGRTWSQVGNPINGTVRALEPWEDGGVAKLVAAGVFTVAVQGPSIRDVAAWDGSTWSALPGANPSFPGGSGASWRAIAALPDGQLVGGGFFGTLSAGPALFLSFFAPGWSPLVISSPKDSTIRRGTNAVLDAQIGVWPANTALACAWRRNGETLVDGPGIEGATTQTLTLLNVDDGDAGSYELVCTAACGSATTVAAQLQVTCAADFDLDGVVDGRDLGAVLAAWGTPAPTADVNQDGIVDGADLAELIAEWGGCGRDGAR